MHGQEATQLRHRRANGDGRQLQRHHSCCGGCSPRVGIAISDALQFGGERKFKNGLTALGACVAVYTQSFAPKTAGETKILLR